MRGSLGWDRMVAGTVRPGQASVSPQAAASQVAAQAGHVSEASRQQCKHHNNGVHGTLPKWYQEHECGAGQRPQSLFFRDARLVYELESGAILCDPFYR